MNWRSELFLHNMSDSYFLRSIFEQLFLQCVTTSFPTIKVPSEVLSCVLIELQGVQRLVSQLCQSITLSYGDDMQCPFNHLITYRGDFVWHIRCIDIFPNALKIAGFNFCHIWINCVTPRVAIWDFITKMCETLIWKCTI